MYIICFPIRHILYFQKHGLDPLSNTITIASACMKIFRQKYLKPNTIGIVPHGGYRANERQSVTAIKWLKWISETENVDIQHAHNGREVSFCLNNISLTNKLQVHIGKYKIDGQRRDDPTQLYEFYGCIWHGCPTCFPNRSKRLPKSKLTAHDAYEQTIDRENHLKAAG